jgi:penicillin amidase
MALSINWTYADKMGNTGYIHNGRYPIRHPDVDVRLPSPGTGEYEWLGYHPFCWNPKCKNPARGFMANWNNRPSVDFPSGDRIWNSYQRVYRIIDDLKSKPTVSFQDMKDINKDIGFIHLDAIYFSPYFLNNIGGGLDQQMTEAINKLNIWDKYQVDENDDGKYDAPGLTIWNRWWSEAIKATLQDELGSTYYNDASLFLHLLQGSDSNIPLSRDYLNGIPVSVMLQNSLETALSALQTQFGTSNMDLWLTPRREHTFNPNNFLGIPQALIPVRNLRQNMNRGTENHIVKLGRGDVSGVNINPPGQSGFVAPDGTPSPHYADQLDMFEDYKGYKPMLHDIGQVLSNLESTESITIP